MKFSVLTIFPEMIREYCSHSIIGRGVERGLISVDAVNIRDFTEDKHLKVDDTPYGGGDGMVMTCQPIFDAIESVKSSSQHNPKVVYMSPQGAVLTQEKLRQLSQEQELILLCGHYEGIDERVIEALVDEELSIGDYVLTGGELAAMVVIDGVSRLLPGVLHNDNSSTEESHETGLLEYPQYTKPEVFRGMAVPEVLLSGHHANIEAWRQEQMAERTRNKRPDMYQQAQDQGNPILAIIEERRRRELARERRKARKSSHT